MGTCRHRFDPVLIFFVQVETLLKSRFQDPWFEGSNLLQMDLYFHFMHLVVLCISCTVLCSFLFFFFCHKTFWTACQHFQFTAARKI